MKNLLHSIEKLFGVYRWHPQIALRYLPIVTEIRRSKIKNPSVLEIGSGSLGIAPYLKQEVTGVDLSFSPPFFPLLKQVKGDALKVPFMKQSFDFVLMVDVLEHLSKKSRERAISEMIRVAKHEVIIAVPFGKQAELQDEKLSKHYEKRAGQSFDFFDEHLRFGLPKRREIKEDIKNAARRFGRTFILQTKDNLNLTIQRFLMRGWMTQNSLVNFVFRKVFLLFIPILRLCNFKPTYRKVFFIQFKDNGFKNN